MCISIETINRDVLIKALREYQNPQIWDKIADYNTVESVIEVCINIVRDQKQVKKSVLTNAQNMALDFWRNHYDREAIEAHKKEHIYGLMTNNPLLHGFYKGQADAYNDIATVLGNLCSGYSGVGTDKEERK